MAVGFPTKANWAAGDVLTASQMDDLAGTLNTVSAPLYNAAGKNVILNGDMRIWQRGTSFSLSAGQNYTVDRFYNYLNAGSITTTQQTFTPGTAPVAGYEGAYFMRLAQTGGGSSVNIWGQKVEDVRVYAGQTITVSFWAKASVGIVLNGYALQNFGSGGSGTVTTSLGATSSLTSSWTRYTFTVSNPSITGKTIGTSSFLDIQFQFSSTTTTNIDIWGVQVEAGSTATGFQTATGTLQGELAACQRYLPAFLATGNGTWNGLATSTTNTYVSVKLPVTARVAPTGITIPALSNFQIINASVAFGTATAVAFDSSTADEVLLQITTAAGNPTISSGQGDLFRIGASGYILFTGCEL